ncbi:MAG TPA: F0F1 ATP synthase subunit delta [Candidatus Saccharibacteria bacterium]|jgi:F0F1-type ATP synthase delta subunit|nr:F0F1 ATP synthase subunit delta [Candidatus Saccharibacteria bacterium]
MYSIKQISKKSAQLLVDGQREQALSLITSYVKLGGLKNNLDLIIDQVMLELYKLTGQLNLEITSAFNLDQDQLSSIKKYIGLKLNITEDKLRVNLVNDPSIIGGFKAKTPIAEVDRSVKNKLNQLKSIK